MKNVVAYCRVSTDGQAGEDKFGIESQKRQIMEYCAQNDMQISEWYIDEGISGVKEERPELDRLLYGPIKNPPVEAVIVAKSDRMARDIKLYFYYLMLLQKKKIELISASEKEVDDGSGMGNVYKALMLFVAEQERKNITRRTEGGRKIKAARGEYSGGKPPYGYKVENGQLALLEEEARIVREVFAMRAAGKSLPFIANTLNDRRRKTRKGGPFYPVTVKNILDNERTYRGEYRYGKGGGWVKGSHEPILREI